MEIRSIWGLRGYVRLYDYGLKHNHMITEEAEQRLKILLFWRSYGLKATRDAYEVSRSTLFGWWKIYKDSGCVLSSLNPGSQAPHKRNKRTVDSRIVKEIKRLRFDVCPNMGKDKIKVFLDEYCDKLGVDKISVSKIGRLIKDHNIYHRRREFSHLGKPKVIKKAKKRRKPKDFKAEEVGDLVEIDTIERFDWGIKRYIITAVDIVTRYAFAYSYTSHGSASAKDFFKKVETVFPYKIKSIQTDNGTEFHKHFKKYLEKSKTTHFWNYKAKPSKNGHVEKYNRTIQEEFIDQNSSLLENTKAFNHKLIEWLIWYNTKRPHWSLNLKSPVDNLLINKGMSNMY